MSWGVGVPLKGAAGANGAPGASYPPVPPRSSLAGKINSGWAQSLAGGILRRDAAGVPATTTSVDIPLDFTALTGTVGAVEVSLYITGSVDQLALSLIAPDGYGHDILVGWDAGGSIGTGPSDAQRVVIADDGPISSAHTGGAHTGRMHPDEGYCDWNNTDKAMNSPARFGGRPASGIWTLRARHYFAAGSIQVVAASVTITASDDTAHAASGYKWGERYFLEGLVRWAGALDTADLISGTPLDPENRPARDEFFPVVPHPSSPAAVRGFTAMLKVGLDGTIRFVDGLWGAGARPAGGSTAIPPGTIFSLDPLDWRTAP